MKKYTIEKDQQQKIVLTQPGEYLVELVGESAEAEIFGAFLVENNQHQEVKVVVRHLAAHTRAQTMLKAVGRDGGVIKLAGKIIIEPDCPDSQSFLTERVLLLDETARAEAVPDLEIKTDDVKCSHAASVSSLPEDEIFYLMSRGLTRKVAEGLVVEGFLEVG
ncbi:MAG: SufB/SufD family protein [Patescibacteria group bacterium]